MISTLAIAIPLAIKIAIVVLKALTRRNLRRAADQPRATQRIEGAPGTEPIYITADEATLRAVAERFDA